MMWVCILAGACMACVWVTLDEGGLTLSRAGLMR